MYEDQRSTVLAVDNLNGATVLERTLRVDHVKKYRQQRTKGEDGEWKEAEKQRLNAVPILIGDCLQANLRSKSTDTWLQRTKVPNPQEHQNPILIRTTPCVIICYRNGEKNELGRRPRKPSRRVSTRMRPQKRDGLERNVKGRRRRDTTSQNPKG